MSKIEAKIKITFLDYYNFFCHTDFILNKLVEKKLTFNLYSNFISNCLTHYDLCLKITNMLTYSR